MQPDNEFEPNAPDWSNEPLSDKLLVDALKKKLDVPIWKRGPQYWRERGRIKKMLKKLERFGFTPNR